MKRALSRSEWLLIGAPLVGFGIFAALWARWKATAPATLDPSPVALYEAYPTRDGRFILGLGQQLDALNRPVPNAPFQIMRWNAKTGRIEVQLSESRLFSDGSFSDDGEKLALYQPGTFNRATRTIGTGTLVVRRTLGGDELNSWSITSERYFTQYHLAFSPDERELLLLGDALERFDIASGRSLGKVSASKIFSPGSGLQSARFSPDGHKLALLEVTKHLPDNTTSSNQPPSAGGRIVVCEFPSLRVVMKVKSDLYSSCEWESNAKLWAVAPLMAGNVPQKLVRAEVNIPAKTTRFDALELPVGVTNWNIESLAINGATAQILFSNPTQITLWGRDGKLETTFGIRPRDLPKGAYSDPTSRATPHFAPDGQTFIRINGQDVERYDLSRFLPTPTPTK